MDTSAPIPLPPKAPASGRFLRVLVLFLLLLMGCGALGVAGLPLGRKLLQVVAGYGNLEWRGAEDWIAVTSAQRQQRQWREGSAFITVDWRELRKGLWLGELELRRSPNPQQLTAVLLKMDPQKWHLEVGSLAGWAKGSVAEIAAENGFIAAINASYFADDGPVGLVVSGGELLHPQTRRWAAHLLIPKQGTPRIVNQKKAGWSGIQEAIQAFPAIMTEGRTFPYMRYGGRGFDVQEVDRRSAICITWDNQPMLLATDTVTNGLSFVELATILGGLGCRDAMGLDGGTSTGFSLTVDDESRRISNLKPVPVVLGVRE